jgi:hypothetical protein
MCDDSLYIHFKYKKDDELEGTLDIINKYLHSDLLKRIIARRKICKCDYSTIYTYIQNHISQNKEDLYFYLGHLSILLKIKHHPDLFDIGLGPPSGAIEKDKFQELINMCKSPWVDRFVIVEYANLLLSKDKEKC